MRIAQFAKLTLAAAALTVSASAYADTVPFGTVSAANLFTPVVSLTSNPSTYTATMGATFEVIATQGLSSATGGNGTLNGSVMFSNAIGTTITDVLPDLFMFSDGKGGTYDFSGSTVTTRSFANTPGVTSSGSLYLLGTTVDSFLGETTPTPTSLTVSFNSTGGSPYSSSLTLAIPPSGTSVTPEPTSLVLLGTGLLGVVGAARRRYSL